MFAFLTGRPMAAVNRGVRTDAKAGVARRMSTLLAGIALGVGLQAAPAQAAENASILRVQVGIEGSCTAASPTWLGMTYRVTGATDDDGAGHDFIEAHILDGNNTVIWSHTGNNSLTPGISITANRFMAQGATPADDPYTGILIDSTSSTRIYSANDTVDLTDPRIIASADLDVHAVEPDCPGGVPDTIAPQLSSVSRSNPATELTNADSLTWRVAFDEGVTNVDAADFAVAVTDFGATGPSSGAIAVAQQSDSVYNVTLSGGELAAGRGVYALSIVAGHDIEDSSGNGLASTTPSGANETYEVGNAAPVLASVTRQTPTQELTAADSLTWEFLFSEITNTTSMSASDFTLTGSTASLSVSRFSIGFTVTASGGDLADLDGAVSIALIDGFVDEYGNVMLSGAPTGTNENSYTLDNTAPDATLTSTATDPVTGAFSLTVTFSEAVTGFELSDLEIANAAATDLVDAGGGVFTVTVTPIAAGGLVTVDLPGAVATDAAGNSNTAATQFSITALATDTTPPDVVLSTSATDPVSGAFAITATFSEDVTGFELADLVVGNGVASNFSAVSASVYTADITPTTDGAVTVDVATGAASDGAGNPSTAAAQFSINTDATPPGLVISLPGATVEGTFTATFTFSEGVTGFEVSDIAVTNGAASALTPGATGVYTATITPETVGTLTISVPEGAAQDTAGNESAADNASVDVVFPAVDVDLDLGSTVLDPNSVTTNVTLSNPGSLAVNFVASVDVPWADVTPSSGTIPASGSIQFTVGLNAEADGLDPGEYSGTVTVTTAAPAGQASQASRGPASAGATVLANIPVTASIAARFGSLQIVATTPGGTHGDETFTYASTDADLGGLSLTTSGGAASSAPIQKIFGTYDLAQSLPQGWALESLTCVGDTDGGSVIDLAAGSVDIDLDPSETIVCTFANTRDADAVRLATLRAINNYMVRRADRILTGAPDLSTRLRDRTATTPGRFSADVDGANVTMNFAGSLSGLRNHAKANERQVPDGPQLTESGAARFDAWFSASYDALDDDRAGDQAESRFGLFQLGADWLVADNALVGIMVQIDQMSETADNPVEAAGAVSGAEIDGTGWMAGPYAVWEFAPGTTLDVLAMWGRSENTINPLGFYEDEFETTRLMIRANLTGEWSAPRSDGGQLKIRPGVSWAHYEETQDGYTDSLAIAIPEQTISVGRLEAGPEVAYRMDGQRPGSWWEPTAAVRAVWDYDGADLMDESGRSIDDGQLRADATVGLRGQWANGAHVSAQARFSGLGNNDFSANGVRVELRMPF
ncbi:Ig-like domain-containing protein [Maricaulis sp.]|uniref:Ig-like domain-containing protein n=1 Tax=Maricaulis sp. TaxID=1486257 RepID=UPI002B27BBA2|nr:Ig-like domain-containing protein [Maricaulis sp.]